VPPRIDVADVVDDEVLVDQVEHRRYCEHDDLEAAAHALLEQFREHLPLAGRDVGVAEPTACGCRGDCRSA
jgi:hypothetical protein